MGCLTVTLGRVIFLPERSKDQRAYVREEKVNKEVAEIVLFIWRWLGLLPGLGLQ